MKKIIFSIALFSFALCIQAQDQLDGYLADAKSSYSSGNLEDTRFALQQSLNELYLLIGKKILAELPQQLGEAKAITEGDQFNGTLLGYSGVFIDRSYQNAAKDKNVQINLVHDSPLMSGIGSFLASPLMSIGSGRKMLKIDGYKSSLERDESNPKNYTLYIPFSKSLITVEFQGYESETDVIGLANQLPIGRIAEIAK